MGAPDELIKTPIELGGPGGEVAIAYRIKERVRDFSRAHNLDEARAILEELKAHCLKMAMPPKIQKLGRTIRTWFDKLCNYHIAWVSNGPTEALNNLIKRIKRIGFGFGNFKNYRIRALSMRARPTGSYSPRSHPAEIRRVCMTVAATPDG